MKKDKSLTIKQETVHVVNPITGKSADIVLHRDGHTDQKLAMVLLSPDASKEQKDSWVSNWLFERGKENASFIAELFVSKGVHLKETQAFKRQIRFDFESFANTMVLLLQDVAEDIKEQLKKEEPYDAKNWSNLSKRFESGAKLIERQRERITDARMREKGYGVYLDRSGQAYSIFDEEIEGVIKKDKEEIEKERNCECGCHRGENYNHKMGSNFCPCKNEKQTSKKKDGIEDDIKEGATC